MDSRRTKRWWTDLKGFKALIIQDDDQGVPRCLETLPITYEVCHVCRGKGIVVDPNVDDCGISQEDFDNDPRFEEAYFEGLYDIQCPYCQGLQ